MEKLLFEPLDTLFFRDGQPFNRGEGNSGLSSLFPPSPLTMVGAARAAWARDHGWQGKGKWDSAIEARLGGNRAELNGLGFIGPLLEKNGQLVFPAPASLIGLNRGNEQPDCIARLKPGPAIHCDLGDAVRLPQPDLSETDTTRGRKPLHDWWLTSQGLEQLLDGKIPAKRHFIHQTGVWVDEPRVGNEINKTQGTVEEGMLYATQHVRLAAGTVLTMYLSLKETPPRPFPDLTQVPLGGEARSCWLRKNDEQLDLPAAIPSAQNGKIHYAVYVLTPLATETSPKPGEPFETLPGVVVSACLRRAQRWGGWDSTRREPLPMSSHLPPGSVLFMEADQQKMADIEQLPGSNIGQRKSWGFGLITIGRWT